jgi:hypothetical protein
MRPISDNWGTPDPRKSAAYPAPATTSMTRWAWEFLRRRDDYRRAWQKLVQAFVAGDRFDLAAVDRHNADALKPASRPFHWTPPWDALRDDFKVYGDPVSRTLHNRTLDPRLEQPPWFEGLGVSTVEFSARVTPPSKMLIEFNLDLPIDRQLKDAEAALFLAAKARGVKRSIDVRPQLDLFPLYLRLLDFRAAAGAYNKEIRDHLFPKLRDKSDEVLHVSINQSLEQAHRWQRDYWHIALHSPT